ncbi:MAG: bifunctional phosphoribosylaminoimidazolecarboxamide formyltransferase/IMP cyclohydrolase [SAR202 cluster bacterium Casp-Chloro-G4]|nr:bifunctional phosphoribosylaminoimidazolecarboxamide formyltransferase/IMP cyclohydrolase [Chloroflexota bacterium]MDA1226712.1 bifunctional phosphoribosylaminoimidazolecarboxamide formyltransferase/IMP cyclohydrolase [Chloroflexota bacterium]PKB61188.1 MAG: bifunctional phosphoribosylaminoimidazolecarboxamide formyltransferase/IMP cyclohydrolase [SAR202 cluster bacterium Casp-Chloro-G4]
MKALLSVYDKTGLPNFAAVLSQSGFELVSTGGTASAISSAGLPVQEVADLTGFPEILDGRVKTLHPAIYGGILARRDLESHTQQLQQHGIAPIHIVVGNLYPFVDTVSRDGATLEDALENIDIGGPTMIRAAAKNFPDVIVVVDPADYGWIGEKLSNVGRSQNALSLAERKALACKAFQHVALYDTAVSQYLGDGDVLSQEEITLGFNRVNELRYGENPHQRASLYTAPLSTGGIVRAKQLHGIDMSFTNILDADAAWKAVLDFAEPAVAVVKHTNPCGLAVHEDQPTAYQRAFEGDAVSAYGGIIAFNRELNVVTAETMRGVLYDIIIAPSYQNGALDILRKRRRTRVLQIDPASGPQEGLDVRLVSGGALVQLVDDLEEAPDSWKVVTSRKPTDAEMADLAFAWRAAKHIKSNTIVLAKDRTLVGMGAGQPNRVVSVHLALRIAEDKAKGSVLASDAFFPFADSIEMAVQGGITAIAQPGGSIRDDEVIAEADKQGIAMVFTGVRHFKH